MSTPQMTTPEALRAALASTIACSAQELQETIGQVVVATAAELPASAAVGPADRSLFDAPTSTLVLLADRIPAGQEGQALAAEIERHHGRQVAQAVVGDRAAELLGAGLNRGKLLDLDAPALEVLVDIARTIGERRFVSGGDSRDNWRDMCEWADEFQAKFESNPEAGETYMEDVEAFAITKAEEAGWLICEAVEPANQPATARALDARSYPESGQWHDLLAPEKARIEFKVIENDPGRSLGAVFVPKGEPLSGGLFGDAQTDMVEFSDLRYGVARAVKYLDAAPIAGISKGQRHSVFFGTHISVDDSQKLAAWVAELQGKGLAKTVDQAALADKAFADYEFGDGVMVTDSSGWEYTSPGHERSRKVYVETEGQDGGPPSSCALNFTVRFDPDTGSLSEAYAMDEKGQIWGVMPSQSALAQEVVTVHDFVGTPPSDVYDQTQTDDSIKDGDVLNLGNGNVAILMKAWPTVVLGEIEHFHRLATGVTFDSVDDGKYAASAAKARELSGYIEQLPSVVGGHAAYEVTPEDVENVLRSNSLAVANTNGKSFESMAEELHGDLDFGLIEQAALAGDDLDEQTDYANDEIARQLREKGVLEPLKQADDSPSPGM